MIHSPPTRIIAGVDHEYYPVALNLLKTMKLASAEVCLLHVVESLMPDGSFPELGPEHPLTKLHVQRDQEGWKELERATSILQNCYPLRQKLFRGQPAQRLIEMAKEFEADLIAVASAQKGKWGSLFFGSVTKALSAEAEQSILVAKHECQNVEALNVVFATDHSPYADRCLEPLLKWGVQGIAHATILTAASPNDSVEQRHDISRRSADYCTKFEAVGIRADFLIRDGDAQVVIPQTMQDLNADLLIVGARGHGFWERLWLGSVAHHQIVATPHNVLVIRAKGA